MFWFIVLATAIVSQVSLAEPLGRSKRSDDYIKHVDAFYDAGKHLIPVSATVFKNTLQKMPNEEAYHKYRHEFEAYLEDVEKYNTISGICQDKTYKLVKKFGEIVSHFKEVANVHEFYLESGGVALDKDFQEWTHLYEKYFEKFVSELEKMPEAEREIARAKHDEVC